MRTRPLVVVIIIALSVLGLSAGLRAGRQDKPVPLAPTLTTEQRLAIENSRLRLVVLQLQADTVQRDLADQVRALEAAHPGWTLDLATLTFRAKTADKSPKED